MAALGNARSKRIIFNARVGSNELACFVDTGANICLIKAKTAEALREKGAIYRKGKNLRVTSASGDTIPTKGELVCRIQMKHRYKLSATIVSDTVEFPGDILLGMDFLERHNLQIKPGQKEITTCKETIIYYVTDEGQQLMQVQARQQECDESAQTPDSVIGSRCSLTVRQDTCIEANCRTVITVAVRPKQGKVKNRIENIPCW